MFIKIKQLMFASGVGACQHFAFCFKIITLGVLISVLLLKVAIAAPITTADLYGICSASDSASAVACRFYVLGAAEGAEASWQEAGAKPLFCIPNTATSTELSSAFEQALKRDIMSHPEIGSLSAVSTALFSFESAYPCGNTKHASAR
jgi:hypothetical protein